MFSKRNTRTKGDARHDLADMPVETQADLISRLCRQMIRCTANGDFAGYDMAVKETTEAHLLPEAIEFLAQYCIFISPTRRADRAEELEISADAPSQAEVVQCAKDLLKACRRDDAAAFELALDLLLEGADDTEGARRAGLLLRCLNGIAVVMEMQADGIERPGVSVVGPEGRR